MNNVSLKPADLTDEIVEIMTITKTTSEQARLVGEGIEVLAEDVSKEKNYLSRSCKFPFLTNTLLTYALQAHFYSGAIDENLDSLKKSFNILTLLSPPQQNAEEYRTFMNSSKNIDVDILLDQPSEKRSAIKKDVFIKGKQDSLEDVITFIANIVTFAKFWVKEQPFVIQMLEELADFISSSEYVSFNAKFKDTKNYMSHTLISYIFNIFSLFVKMAKNPKITRKYQITNMIDINEIRMARVMHNNLLEQLQLCTATSSLQNIFAQPATSFKLFCPAQYKQNEISNSLKRTAASADLKSSDNDNKKKKLGSFGSIVNKTGDRIMFPRNMKKKYCSYFLDTDKQYKHGENCTFVHAVYPQGFSDKDKEILTKFVNETNGLSFAKNVS